MAANQMDDVIQRWRNTQETDLKPEDHELFVNVGQMCMTQGDSAQLLDFISDEKNQDIVKSMGSGLLRPLIKEVVKKPRDSVHRQAVITHLIQICNADKLLDILLKQVEDTDPNAIAVSITLVMQHVQAVLMRLGDSKPASLSLALDALHKQISKLPVPYTHKQEEEDEHGLGCCCTALLTFVQPFVQEVKSQDAKSPVTSTYHARLRTVLHKFCMDSLREPLLEAQLDRETHTAQNSPLWNFAKEIMTTLSAIHEPLPKLLFYNHWRDKEDKRENDEIHLPESRACLAYLLFVQLIAIELFPAVFSPVFMLQCNMEYISILLSRKDEPWILKGLDLYVKSLERVLDNGLPAELLELKIFHTVTQVTDCCVGSLLTGYHKGGGLVLAEQYKCVRQGSITVLIAEGLLNLIQIMTDCPIQHLRVKALVVFQLSIEKLNWEAKHRFFRCIMKTSQHAGVESVILTNIKNQMENSCKSEGQKDRWFKETLLLALLRDTLSLPQGPETDLLHGMDRVMASLNLLRYLLIRERIKSTGIWQDLCDIARSYIKILRVCLSMSKSYYGSELRRLHEDKKLKLKELKEFPDKKSVKHMIAINKAPCKAQEKVLECALVTYDLMESLVIRIEEILEERV